ncbi:MAG: exo-alpha-sialidase, partial [Chloroflexota bacterium]
LAVVALLTSGSVALDARAQAPGAPAVTVTNLSRSASASAPVLLVGARGARQALWLDQFDGVTTALWLGERWSASRPAPILQPVLEKEEAVYKPIGATPTLFGDGQSRAHAFWLGSADRDTGQRPLMYSRLSLGSASWSLPFTMTAAASVWQLAADSAGRLHLAFFRSAHTSAVPSGLYYTRSFDGGASWSAPQALARSLYFSRTSMGTSHLEVVAGAGGQVFVTWDDPETGAATYARSVNSGATWAQPARLHTGAPSARRARLLPVGQDVVLALWESAGPDLPGSLYQQRSADGVTWDPPVRVLESLFGSRDLALLATADGRGLLVAGKRPGQIGLAVWDRSHAQAPGATGWSEIIQLPLRGDPPDAAMRLTVSAWKAALLGEGIELLGQGQDREIWSGQASLADLTWSFQPAVPWQRPAPSREPAQGEWSAPANLSRSGAASEPVIVAGPMGTSQAFWWDRFDGMTSAYYDGQSWFTAVLSPIALRAVSEGQVVSQPIEAMPRIVGDGSGQAHALWLGKAERDTGLRALWHSRLAIGSASWAQPTQLADSALTWELAADSGGGLHLVYVRTSHTEGASAGIYYRRSSDGGETWTLPTALYASVYVRLLSEKAAHLAMAAGPAGQLLVAWDDPRLDEGVIARSLDGGQTWQAPTPLHATGARIHRARPFYTPDGALHLLWETLGAESEGRLYEQYSPDDGRTWGEPQRVLPALRAPLGQVRLHRAAP